MYILWWYGISFSTLYIRELSMRCKKNYNFQLYESKYHLKFSKQEQYLTFIYRYRERKKSFLQKIRMVPFKNLTQNNAKVVISF